MNRGEAIVVGCYIRRLYGDQPERFRSWFMELAPDGPVVYRKLFLFVVTKPRMPLPERILSARVRPFESHSEARRFASIGKFGPGGPREWDGMSILSCQTDRGVLEIAVWRRDLDLVQHYIDAQRRRVGAPAKGLAGMTGLPSSATAAPGMPIPAVAASELKTRMLRMAEVNGDARPSSISAVLTTRGQALLAVTPGDSVAGSENQPAYLVLMRGHFELRFAKVPKGAPIPTGRYLAMTISPSTFRMMDLSLRDLPPPIPLRTYGPVSDLLSQP